MKFLVCKKEKCTIAKEKYTLAKEKKVINQTIYIVMLKRRETEKTCTNGVGSFQALSHVIAHVVVVSTEKKEKKNELKNPFISLRHEK